MTAHSLLRTAMARCPLVAILRGVRPEEVEEIAEALLGAGFAIIEVPLNSPDALESIARLQRFAPDALIGAGTVLTPEEVGLVAETGARLVISPNVNVDVIARAGQAGPVSLPGYSTPSEAFSALGAGATALKLFPADGIRPPVLAAQRAVLPPALPVLVVGGVTPRNIARWSGVADGFGLGSALYRPGFTAAEVAVRARAFVSAASRRP